MVEPFSNQEEYQVEVERLKQAAELYYSESGEVLMDDATYDQLIRRVATTEELHPDWTASDELLTQVAGGQSQGGAVIHTVPMLSLANAMDKDETEKWYSSLSKLLGIDSIGLIVEPKLDGLALSARYVDGVLVQVSTRGNGQSGDDVTAQMTKVNGLPQQLSSKATLEVRGECVMTRAQFEKANEQRVAGGKAAFVNSRNAVAGIVRSIHAKQATELTFAAYGLVDTTAFKTHLESMEYLVELGFQTASKLAGTNVVASGFTAAQELVDSLEDKRASLEFDIDGAVIKCNKYSDQVEAGATSKAPRWAIARKYPADTKITKLLDIKLQIGRLGAVTPVGVVEPVFVGGTTITNVTLHNQAEIARKDLRISDMVTIYRAGEVIPSILGRFGDHAEDSQPFVMPDKCPRCGTELDKSQEVWRCTNAKECGKAEAIRYFASRTAMDIEGMGESVVLSLVDAGLINNIADLYKLTVKDLSNLVTGTNKQGNELRLGKLRAAKVLKELEKSKTNDLHQLFTGLGLRHTGERMSLRLAKAFGNIENIQNASIEELSNVEGMGDIKAKSVFDQLKESKDLIEELKSLGLNTTEPEAQASEGPLKGKTVVITGSITGLGRKEAQTRAESLGAKVSSSVSSKTDLVIVGADSGSKADKAEKLGVTIMTGDEFLALQ